MESEVWSAFHSQLRSFRPYEQFESAFIVKRDICIFNLSYKEPEVDRLPENEHDLNYDADNPDGLYKLTDRMCKCQTKYISNNILLFVKMDCDVYENDNGLAKVDECMNVNKRDCFDIYFERALYNIDWHAFAIEFVNLNKNNPYIKQFSNEVFYHMEVEKVFKKIENNVELQKMKRMSRSIDVLSERVCFNDDDTKVDSSFSDDAVLIHHFHLGQASMLQ
ncbi:PC4 domain-containing protein [Nephila pilipes]|uniref:PC4 domain-containing protein n=1 Tax=Nephila pilipes TaxID=299642 RepID=A0A8X6NGS1_NEPPI|nr:PC4 domain-containing protein [Nephila pilipes]